MTKRRQSSRTDRQSSSEELAVQQQQAANTGAAAGQTVAFSQTHFTEISTGPLPPPSMLAEYDRIIPGAAERILNLAEQQTKHRIELEKSAIRSEISRSWTGLWMGLIVSLAAIGGGVLVAILASPTAGATIATASVVALASVFVYGTSSRRKERDRKAEQMRNVIQQTKNS